MLNGRSTFTEESLDRFWLNMDRLEIIQSEIFGINHINRVSCKVSTKMNGTAERKKNFKKKTESVVNYQCVIR